MHKWHMHHGVALLSGRANRSAKLGWQKERVRPARSYCQPMMHFIFIFQVNLVGNWLICNIMLLLCFGLAPSSEAINKMAMHLELLMKKHAR